MYIRFVFFSLNLILNGKLLTMTVLTLSIKYEYTQICDDNFLTLYNLTFTTSLLSCSRKFINI